MKSRATDRLVRIVHVLAFALLATFATLWCYSSWMAYDDQGYFMLAVRNLLDGARPYEDFELLYGPFYFAWRWLLHGALHVPLTTDAVRAVTIVEWLAVVLLFVGWTRRSAAPGVREPCTLATITLLGFFLCGLSFEPGHSHEIVLLVVAGWAALAARIAGKEDAWYERHGTTPVPRDAPAPPAPAGTRLVLVSALACGLLVGTKVNIGVFVGLALALLLLERLSPGTPRFVSRSLAMLAAIACPFVLLARHLEQEWASNLAWAVALSVVSLGANAPSPSAGRALALGRALRTAALALAGTLVAAVAVAAAFGCSPAALFHGALVVPLAFPAALVSPMVYPAHVLGTAVVCCMLSVTLGRARTGPLAVACDWAIGAARIGLAWAQVESLTGPGAFVAYGPALAALAVQPLGADERAPARTFARRGLAWIVVLGILQVYPVSGTQTAIATAPLVPLTIVLLAGLVLHVGPVFVPMWRARITRVALWSGAAWTTLHVWDATSYGGALRNATSSLDLPGAHFLRVSAEDHDRMRWMAHTLARNGSTFLNVSSANSLYFWTGKRPPNHALIVHSWDLVPLEEQQRLVESLEREADPWIVDHIGFFGAIDRESRPVLAWIEHNTVPIAGCGDFTLRARAGGPPLRFVECAWRITDDERAHVPEAVAQQAALPERFVVVIAPPQEPAGSVLGAVALDETNGVLPVARTNAGRARLHAVLFDASGRVVLGGTDRAWTLDPAQLPLYLSVPRRDLPACDVPPHVWLFDEHGALTAALPLVRMESSARSRAFGAP